MTASSRIYLSPPHLSGQEGERLAAVLASNWVAPLGPEVEGFERDFSEYCGGLHALALSSGTAALHLALQLAGVGPGDEVLISTLTFVASVSPVGYLGGSPAFIDSEAASWNMDPALLSEALELRARQGRLPRAVVVVHLYGQSANLDAIGEACRRHGVPLIEDAAESLGASYRDRVPGTLGQAGIFSFNGNKIITTSGGGMLVSPDEAMILRARKLATQARERAAHYEHVELGYNYRLSNVLAAIGRAQLGVLEERVQIRRRNFEFYRQVLGHLPGLRFMPEAPWGRHSRWLTTLTIDPGQFGADRETVRLALEGENIESRPLWKPMHLQPVFRNAPAIGGAVAERLFANGLCLPSGSALTESQLARIADVVLRVHQRARRSAAS
jgi:dTDP-4-amino-4,6-dideoxygalactose transaminase